MKKIIFFLLLTIVTSTIAQIKVGDKLPTIKLEDATEQEVFISANQSQYTLVDFWASWCSICRKANKDLVKLSSVTSKTDLKIIGISLDADKTKWVKAIEKDGIDYMQLNDPNGFEANTALQFGVEQLPATYLFDKSGKLIAINPTPTEIINILKLN